MAFKHGISRRQIMGIYPAISYIQVFGGDRLCWRSSSGSSGSVRAQDWLDLQDRLWGSEKLASKIWIHDFDSLQTYQRLNFQLDCKG